MQTMGQRRSFSCDVQGAAQNDGCEYCEQLQDGDQACTFIRYSQTSSELLTSTNNDIVAFLTAFQTNNSKRLADIKFLFGLTLVDPHNLTSVPAVSIAKLTILFRHNLRLAGATKADLRESTKNFVHNTAPTPEFLTGQDLITWHREQLLAYDKLATEENQPADPSVLASKLHTLKKRKLFHEFALSIMPILLVNTKSESTFSRHKRLLRNDRTNARTAVIDSQCVLQDDHRLKGSFSNIDLAQFARVEKHLVHVGDSSKQEKHIQDFRMELATHRKPVS